MSGLSLQEEQIERIFLGLAVEAQKQIPSNLQRTKKKVIVIAGPTAAGKSALALSLAQLMDGEIISADSMQIYRGMDIGTSKPSFEERALVKHHLVDIREIVEPFNVVDFYYEARHCCQGILEREKVPIIVGGSGFYIHALIYGPPSGPPSVPEVRQGLEEEMQRLGPDMLYDRLMELDAPYAKSITRNDRHKIIRGLEIISLTGKKVSRLSWAGRRKPLNFDFRCWFLHRPKESLYHRIEKRCEKMVDEGFLEEVEHLEKIGLRKNLSASQAIGYRQALEYLSSLRTRDDFKHFLDSFKQASRNYAKRQFTWFRKEHLFGWLDLDLHDMEVILDIIRQDFERAL